MKNKTLYFLSAVAAAILANSCDLDINRDPYAVTNLDVAQLLTAAENEVGCTFAGGYYLNQNFSSYVQHTCCREVDNYGITPGTNNLSNTWLEAYVGAIKNCDALIENASKEETKDDYYKAIGNVLRTYVYMGLTDLWGDVPYSQANNPDCQTPAPDKSADIYKDLLARLNSAIADLSSSTPATYFALGSNDLLYNGDTGKWLKAASTLKLKLLVQTRKAKSQIPDYDTELSSVLAANNFLGRGEDLQFPHSTAQTPSDERNADFVSEYEGGQKTMFISPWLYETMSGLTYNFTDNPLKNIRDPRIPYYWVNQLTEDDTADNNTDYRDGGFVSIFLGSKSGFSSSSNEKSISVVGIYPVGGKYDDGEGCVINAKSGTGVAPDKMLMAYSVPFLKAELVLAGLYQSAPKTALDYLEEGVKESIAHVNSVTKLADPTAPLIGTDAEAEFVQAIKAKFNAADNAGKMELVMTQKWIANYFNPLEAYNDIRRTGYPKLFKGNDDHKAVSPYEHTADPAPGPVQFEVGTILDYPRIMWYPTCEVQVNPNFTNEGRILKSYNNVFWDVE